MRAGVGGVDVALAKLRAEAIQQPDLLVGQAPRALGRVATSTRTPQQRASRASLTLKLGGHLDAAQHQCWAWKAAHNTVDRATG